MSVVLDSTLFDKALGLLLAPFQSWERFLFEVLGVLRAMTELGNKTGWPYLLSSLVVTAIMHCVARRRDPAASPGSFWRFIVPREVYGHRSARADYRFVVVDLSIRGLIYVPLFWGAGAFLYRGLVAVLRPLGLGRGVTLSFEPPLLRWLVVTVLFALAADFAFFYAHYLLHRIAFLWPFHEIHHSAEVLTPVTVYRVHPVEDLLNALVSAGLSAVGAATVTLSSGHEFDVITVFGINLVSFLFFTMAFQLRHSHVWLSYGRVLSFVFISPAQHQIHHSIDSKHWDKNFGFTFAVWDLMFGTLYVPRRREEITYGVPDSDPQDFATVSRLYFLPFVKAARVVGRWGSRLAPRGGVVRDLTPR